MHRRSFFPSIVSFLVVLFFGVCRKVFGRWWHGTPGDTRWLARHMMGPKHRVAYNGIANLSYRDLEQLHENDHRVYGTTPSNYGMNRKTVVKFQQLARRHIPASNPRNYDRFMLNRMPSVTKQKKVANKKRLYVVGNKLVFK